MKITNIGQTMGFIMTMAFLFVTMHTSLAVGDELKQPQHSIVLSAGDGPFVFGRDISMHVSYRNDGKTPWVVPTPTESISVLVRCRRSKSNQMPGGYSLGRITLTTIKGPDGQTITAREFPEPKPISIAPGKTHEFKVKFERDWNGDIVPGIWTVWIHDETLKLKSNRVKIPLRFTAESVAICLDIALDKKQDVYMRNWHARWLQKIMPGLKLQWWTWQDKMSPKEKQEREDEIQRQLKAFQEFWKDKNNAQAIKKAIANINLEAARDAKKPKTEKKRELTAKEKEETQVILKAIARRKLEITRDLLKKAKAKEKTDAREIRSIQQAIARLERKIARYDEKAKAKEKSDAEKKSQTGKTPDVDSKD